MVRAKIKNILLIMVILLLLVLTVSPIGYLIVCNFCYTRVESSECFLNGDYVSYNGGGMAQQFFEEYIDTTEYKNISFKYADKEKKKGLRDYYTIFVLDIQYEKEKYEQLKQEILPYTDNPDPDNLDNYYSGFLITKLTFSEKCSKNYCGIYFSEPYHIIRYVFIKDITEKEIFYDGIIDIIENNISVQWNRNQKDLIFRKT